MATHSSVLAWRIPGTGEHGGLPSMGLHRVRHDWSDLAAAAAFVEYYCVPILDFLVVQTVKNLPARQETRVRSLGWEVPLKKGMANHSTILAWRIPWTEKPGGLQSIGWQRVGHEWVTHTHTHTVCQGQTTLVPFTHIKLLILLIHSDIKK